MSRPSPSSSSVYPQTLTGQELSLWHKLKLLIYQNKHFEISKVYGMGMQRYRNWKIIVCDKDCFVYGIRNNKSSIDFRSTFVISPRNNFHHLPVDGWILYIYILALIWIKKLVSLGSEEITNLWEISIFYRLNPDPFVYFLFQILFYKLIITDLYLETLETTTH